jgi:hypothetical protein
MQLITGRFPACPAQQSIWLLHPPAGHQYIHTLPQLEYAMLLIYRAATLAAACLAGHQCIHTVSQLKKYAMVSDFSTLMSNVHEVGRQLGHDTHHTTRGLEHIKRDAGGAHGCSIAVAARMWDARPEFVFGKI